MPDHFPEKLTREEAEALAELAIAALGPDVRHVLTKSGFSPVDLILFVPVAGRFAANREKLGMTIKEVSKELRVPQYRLRAIETPNLRELKGDVAARYAEFLNLSDWYRDWCADNEDFVEKFGLATE